MDNRFSDQRAHVGHMMISRGKNVNLRSPPVMLTEGKHPPAKPAFVATTVRFARGCFGCGLSMTTLS